ncbi:MAG: hypothetical protein ACI87H_002397 [Gammaproteobacteria bacterium]|jgi:hypothetical protein
MRRPTNKSFFPVLLTLVISVGIGYPGVAVMAQELKDPTQPPEFALKKFRQAKLAKQTKTSGAKVVKPSTKTEAKSMQLSSILISNNRKIAIIDDQMLAVGESIQGARVTRITRHAVRLIRKGKIINLTFQNSLTAVKKMPVTSDL